MDSANDNKAARKPFGEMTDEEFRAHCASYLEHGGWKRDIAGEDWERGLDAFVKSARRTDQRQHGILVTGVPGCGKTAFVNAIGHRSRDPWSTLRLANRNELDRIDRNAEAFDGEAYEAMFSGNVFLDDLGAECLTNDYGVKRDLVGDFIAEYHYRGTCRLYITTNLSAEELANRYGGRVADRLKELCVPLVFKGKSKRQWMR